MLLALGGVVESESGISEEHVDRETGAQSFEESASYAGGRSRMFWRKLFNPDLG